MNAPLQVIRFRTAAAPSAPGLVPRPVVDVHVDSASTPAGQVVLFEGAGGVPSWRYVLRDGRSSGLASEISRVDLETLIIEHYFEHLLPHPQSA